LPKYSYYCERCRETTVVYQTYEEFDKNPVDECPECGGRISQIFSPVPAHFKGDGFFTTDSKDDMAMGESGVMGHRVSRTDGDTIMKHSPQRRTSKGKLLATPTRPTRSKVRQS